MDSILKFIYPNRYIDNDGITQYHLNGVHPAAMQYIKNNMISSNDLHQIIDKIKADNPNSIWDNFFRHSNFLSYYKKYYGTENIIDIDEIKDDGSIYIWPIEVGGTLQDIYTTTNLNVDGNVYNYTLLDTMDERLRSLLKISKVKILINMIHDPLTSCEALYKIEKYFVSMDIDPSNIIILGGNSLNEYYMRYPDAKLKITYGYIMVQQAGDRLEHFPFVSSLGYLSDAVNVNDLNKNDIRPKRFLCWNRTMRSHRIWLAYLALRYNLLENGYFSFLNLLGGGKNTIETQISNLAGRHAGIIYGKKVYSLIPHDLDTHHLSPEKKIGFPTNNNKKDLYLNSYVHITSETVFEESFDCPFYSEKTFHPMVNLQPFIYVGCYGALKLLKEWGIKTFHPFIDESYDNEKNPLTRFKLIAQEIKKLNGMPIQELHDWYYSITDVLIHNQNVLKQFSSTNPFANALADIKKFYERN